MTRTELCRQESTPGPGSRSEERRRYWTVANGVKPPFHQPKAMAKDCVRGHVRMSV